jgi:monovalent cation:H+ antiporter-2, CPA2 family
LKCLIDTGSVAQTNEWRNLIRRAVVKIFANGVVVIAIFLITAEYFDPWLLLQIDKVEAVHAISLVVAFTLSAPFLWALTFGRVGDKNTAILWRDSRYRIPLFVFEISRWLISLFLCAALSSRIAFAGNVIIAVSLVVVIAIFLLSRYFRNVYFWLERRFISNLHEKEVAQKAQEPPVLAPWDAHLAELRVSSDSPLMGKKFSDLLIRERFGVTIALIVRGRQTIPAPGRSEVLYPADILRVLGTDEQISRFKEQCDGDESDLIVNPGIDFELKSIFVKTNARFVNKTIRDCGLREATQGLVVGIEKNGVRTLNPDAMTLIESGDVLWVVGNQKLISEI